MGHYKTHREYLVAAIREQRRNVDHGRHEAFRASSRKILQRLCGELDDLDAGKAEATEDISCKP